MRSLATRLASTQALLVAGLGVATASSVRADDPPCHRLVEVLPARAFGQGTHRVTLAPLAPNAGQYFVTASGEGPGFVLLDGKVVVSPLDLVGPRRDRQTTAVRLRSSSRLEVRVPGRPGCVDRLTVRVFGIVPTSALPAGVGKPVGDVVVFDQRFGAGLPARHARQTVQAPGADGVLFLSATQGSQLPVLLSRVLWNEESVLGPIALNPRCGAAASPVVAKASNALETWVLGCAGASMRVRLGGWVVDVAAPAASWTSPAEGGTVVATTTLRLTWSDVGTGVAPERTRILLNGHDVTSAFTLSATSATATVDALPAAALAAGVNVLRATVKDRACNTVVAERRFQRQVGAPDTTPPVVAQPDDLAVEQQTAAGAIVSFAAPAASDDRDPSPIVTCTPASGSTFPAGSTTVSCTARDAAGNVSAPVPFTVLVRDTTAPTFTALPPDLTFEQVSAQGNVVAYDAPTAVDTVDPSVQVVCTPGSGTLFPAGTTTVTCTATDDAGNLATTTFSIVVRDTTSPALAQVADLVVEQAGPAGSVVTFATPTANDAADATVDVTCAPPSGTLFPAGTTTVTCTALDDAGNTSTTSFEVRVRDRTAPTIEPVPELVVEQEGPTGSTVTFSAPTATDAVDASVLVVCTPASGALFPPGVTVVDCSAVDAAGNHAFSFFTVRVLDRTAPTITIVSPQDGSIAGPGALLRVGFTDEVELAPSSLRVFVQGREVTDSLGRTADAAEATLGALGLVDGPAVVEVRLRDRAGNEGSASSSFTYAAPAAATRLAVEIPPAPAAPLQAGQSYDLTLRALTASGDVAPTFTGLVLVRTTDPTSRLNDLVVDFDASHGGVRSLGGLADFATLGTHTVTAEAIVGPSIEGRLDVVVERSERGRVLAVLPTGSFAPGQVFSARIYVDMGASDGDPTTFADTLGAYDVRLLYDRRQLELLRVDGGASPLGAPLFVLPGSVRLMDLNDLGPLSSPIAPDGAATGLVEVASIDLRVREDAPDGAVALAVTGDALTTAEAALPETFELRPVGPSSPRPGVVEGAVAIASGRPAAGGPVVLGVTPRDGDGLVSGVQTARDVWALLSTPIDPATLGAVTLKQGDELVAGTVTLGEDATQVRFTPSAPLAPGLYTLEVGSALASVQQVPLGQAVRTTFRVGPAPSSRPSDLDQDGELAVLDLQVRRDVKTGRTPGTLPAFPPVFLKGAPGTVTVPTAQGADVEIEAVDLEGGPVSFDTSALPDFARLERTSADGLRLTLSGTAGGGTVDLVASNASGEQTIAPLRAVPERVNGAPEVRIMRVLRDGEPVNPTPPLVVFEGSVLEVEVLAADVNFADPAGPDHVAFLSAALPNVQPPAVVSSGGDLAVYRFFPDYDQQGLRTLDVRVQDDAGETASLPIPILVLNRNQYPIFTTELPDGPGSTTFEWVAEDPDGSPVEVALSGESQAYLEQAAASGEFTFSVSKGPGSLRVGVSTPLSSFSLGLTAVASDLENLASSYRTVSRVDPSGPPPPAEPRFEVRNGATYPFPRTTVPMVRYSRGDDPATPDVDETREWAEGYTAAVNVGVIVPLAAITAIEVDGVASKIDFTRSSQTLQMKIELDPPPASLAGGTFDAELVFVAGTKRYRAPVVFVDWGAAGDPPPEYEAPVATLSDPAPKGVGKLTLQIENVELVRQIRFSGDQAGFVLTSGPFSETDRGARTLEFDVHFNSIVTADVEVRVDSWLAPNLRKLSPPTVLNLTRGPRVGEIGFLAHHGRSGALELTGAAPILPAGARAEDQPVTADNPYVLFVVAPDTGRTYDTRRARLQLMDGTSSLDVPLTGGASVKLANGLVTQAATSMPIFFTFRTEPAATLTPIRILGDRIVVSVGAHQGFDGGEELLAGYPLPGRVRSGPSADGADFRADVQLVVRGLVTNSAECNASTFVPGLVIREPGSGYPFPTAGRGRRLFDGAGVWCDETIEGWDPWIDRSSVHVFLNPEGATAVLEPGRRETPLQAFDVHEFLEYTPGLAAGLNRLQLLGPSSEVFDDVTFDVLIGSRAMPAKTGEGLDQIDFTCDGAFPGDPGQETYLQGDVALDDEDGPGTAKVGMAVLLATGEEVFDRVDLVIPGRNGLDFTLSRRYRNQLHYRGPLGYGWDFNWNDSVHLETKDNKLKVHRQNGDSRVASWSALPGSDVLFEAPAGHFGTLVRENATRPNEPNFLVLRMPNGMKHYYSVATGLMYKLENRQGDFIEVFYVSGGAGDSPKIAYIRDVFRRRIEFVYAHRTFREIWDDGETSVESKFERDVITKVVDFTGRVVEYEYDDRGDLVSVKAPVVDGAERVERYTYSRGFPRGQMGYPNQEELNHNLLTVRSPAEGAGGPSTLTFKYGEGDRSSLTYDRVIRETVGGTNASGIAAGGLREFVYEKVPYPDVPQLNTDLAVTVKEPNGTEHVHYIQSSTRLELAARALADGTFYETRTLYNADGLVVHKVHPAGNYETFEYGENDPSLARATQRNLTRHTRFADARVSSQRTLVTAYTYEPLYNQLASVTDARGYAAESNAPDGTKASPERYTRRLFYDYQETGGAGIEEAGRFGIHIPPGWRLNRDLNGAPDDRPVGNCVRIEETTVHFASGGIEDPAAQQAIVTEQQWSAKGALIATIDPSGVVTEFHYHDADQPGGSPGAAPDGDGGGHLGLRIVDARLSSRRSSTLEGGALRLTSSFVYDARGNLIQETDPRDVRTDTEYNAANEVVKVTRGADAGRTGESPLRLVTTMRHDANGRTVEVVTGLSESGGGKPVTTRLSYDILGDLVEREVSSADVPTTTTRYRYDALRNPILVISPENERTVTRYDGRNLAVEVTRGEGSTSASTSRVEYDANGNVSRTVDGRGKATHFSYDGFDRMVKVNDPLGNETLLTLDPVGNVRKRVFRGHPAGAPGGALETLSEVEVHHDELSRPYRVIESLDGGAALTTWTGYDASSRVTYTFDDGELPYQLVLTRYDGAGRPVQRLDTTGNKTTVEYDESGNALKTTSVERAALVNDRTYVSRAVFDQLSRLRRTIDPMGHTRELHYDARDQVELETDAEGTLRLDPATGLMVNDAGNSRAYEVDGLGRLRKETRALRVGGVGGNPTDRANLYHPDGEVVIEYTYDRVSRLRSIRDDKSQTTTFDYDALSRRTTTTLADGRRYTATYDDNDNVLATTDPNGTTITRTYDDLNRVTSLVAAVGSGVVGTTAQTFEYDGLSRLTASRDDNEGFTPEGAGVTTGERCGWTYDRLGRVLTETQNGRVVTSTWSPDGRRRSLEYPGGRRFTYTQDALDRVVAIKEDGREGELARFDWIGPGYRAIQRTYGNGSQLRHRVGRFERGYDDAQRVTAVRWQLGTGELSPLFLDREYTYNREGMRTSETRGDDGQRTDRYTYDSAYRLVRSQYSQAAGAGGADRDVTYTLDGVGNRRESRSSVAPLATLTSVNAVNEYTSVNGVARTHDPQRQPALRRRARLRVRRVRPARVGHAAPARRLVAAGGALHLPRGRAALARRGVGPRDAPARARRALRVRRRAGGRGGHRRRDDGVVRVGAGVRRLAAAGAARLDGLLRAPGRALQRRGADARPARLAGGRGRRAAALRRLRRVRGRGRRVGPGRRLRLPWAAPRRGDGAGVLPGALLRPGAGTVPDAGSEVGPVEPGESVHVLREQPDHHGRPERPVGGGPGPGPSLDRHGGEVAGREPRQGRVRLGRPRRGGAGRRRGGAADAGPARRSGHGDQGRARGRQGGRRVRPLPRQQPGHGRRRLRNGRICRRRRVRHARRRGRGRRGGPRQLLRRGHADLDGRRHEEADRARRGRRSSEGRRPAHRRRRLARGRADVQERDGHVGRRNLGAARSGGVPADGWPARTRRAARRGQRREGRRRRRRASVRGRRLSAARRATRGGWRARRRGGSRATCASATC
jgi:YD repeat-containing protein